jgi:hypothetical protein
MSHPLVRACHSPSRRMKALVSDRIPSPIAALIRAPAVAATDMSCIPLTWLTMRCIGTDWNLARCFWEFSSSKQLSAMTRKRPKTRGHVLRVKTRRSHLRRHAVIACWRRNDSRRLRAYSAARQFGPRRSRWALPGGALASDASHEGTAAGQAPVARCGYHVGLRAPRLAEDLPEPPGAAGNGDCLITLCRKRCRGISITDAMKNTWRNGSIDTAARPGRPGMVRFWHR